MINNLNPKHPILNIKSYSSIPIIELSEVKNFLKVEFEEDDNLIKNLINTAIFQCEKIINKSLLEKTYIYSIYTYQKKIILPYPTIKTINKIEIITKNNSSLLDTNEYFIDNVSNSIIFKNNIQSVYRIDIEYTTNSNLIENDLKQALLMHIAQLYENRNGNFTMPNNVLNIYYQHHAINKIFK